MGEVKREESWVACQLVYSQIVYSQLVYSQLVNRSISLLVYFVYSYKLVYSTRAVPAVLEQ